MTFWGKKPGDEEKKKPVESPAAANQAAAPQVLNPRDQEPQISSQDSKK